MEELKLEIKDLVKIFNSKKILDIPSYRFEGKKVYSLYGPNGAGKTTLLNILAFLIEPTSGGVLFTGAEFRNSVEDKRNLIKEITLVQQNPYLFNTTVEKNISYGLRIRGMAKEGMRKRVGEALSMVGLAGFEKRKAKELSGGEVQRVAIARGLALKPKVLLLDEPTANIDEASKGILEKVIAEVNKKYETTVIFSTHNLSLAYRVSHEVIPLFEGRIVASPVENIMQGKIIKFNEVSVFDTGRVKLDVVAESPEATRISINPEEILVSREKISSSARNSFKGRVIQISEEDRFVNLVVDIGEKLKVKLTKKSFNEMALTVGSEIYLTFKSSTIQIF